jgi:hypothetical protein
VDNFSGLGLKKGGLTRVKRCGMDFRPFKLLSGNLVGVLKKSG